MTPRRITNKKVVHRAGYVTWFFERVVEPHHKTFRMSICFTPDDYKVRREYVVYRLRLARKILREGVRTASLDDGKEWQ